MDYDDLKQLLEQSYGKARDAVERGGTIAVPDAVAEACAAVFSSGACNDCLDDILR